jgi:hypothetical protein
MQKNIVASVVFLFFRVFFRSAFSSAYCCRHQFISMADDQDTSNELGDETEVPSVHDQHDATTAAVNPDSGNPAGDDYVDEPIADYVVKLVVNESPDGVTISPDLAANALVTDINGHIISSKQSTIIDTINEYSTAAYNELNGGNGTGITTGSKRWWGWSTQKIIIFGLIALLILAIILAILFIVLRKKFSKKNQGPVVTGTTKTTKTTKNVVTKGIDPKYQSVQTA